MKGEAMRGGAVIPLVLMLLSTCYAHARDYLKDDFPQSRGFSTGVVVEGGKTVYLAGQNALVDEQGKPLAGNLEGQARSILRKIDGALKRSGGGLKDVDCLSDRPGPA
jgi:enamine deaminase RidA (YjgF/YER057c/UK114 family)